MNQCYKHEVVQPESKVEPEVSPEEETDPEVQ